MDESKLTKDDYKFAQKIINELDEKLSKMSDEERKEYFKKMGFTIDEEPQKQLKKKEYQK